MFPWAFLYPAASASDPVPLIWRSRNPNPVGLRTDTRTGAADIVRLSLQNDAPHSQHDEGKASLADFLHKLSLDDVSNLQHEPGAQKQHMVYSGGSSNLRHELLSQQQDPMVYPGDSSSLLNLRGKKNFYGVSPNLSRDESHCLTRWFKAVDKNGIGSLDGKGAGTVDDNSAENMDTKEAGTLDGKGAGLSDDKNTSVLSDHGAGGLDDKDIGGSDDESHGFTLVHRPKPQELQSGIDMPKDNSPPLDGPAHRPMPSNMQPESPVGSDMSDDWEVVTPTGQAPDSDAEWGML